MFQKRYAIIPLDKDVSHSKLDYGIKSGNKNTKPLWTLNKPITLIKLKSYKPLTVPSRRKKFYFWVGKYGTRHYDPDPDTFNVKRKHPTERQSELVVPFGLA